MTTDQVENHLQISHGSKHEMIRKRLLFHNILKHPRDAHKRKLLDTCLPTHHNWGRNIDTLLRTIEKENARVWNGNIRNRRSKESSKRNEQRENDVHCFWDYQKPILEHYQEKGTTVNSARFCEMMCDRLRPAIRRKRQELVLRGVLLCMTMPAHTLPSVLLKPSGNCTEVSGMNFYSPCPVPSNYLLVH
ncbi:hypothetical protein Cfor_01807 [Coptotermes formosanus]|uniref:Uncharacterized protein n=1 Tax=Coptotermes formosanus TaxID=36987 RepID=A0A6L2PQ65_COPFO|nr:hypothetical protein Cfor_01807 [Coptotermes formosanus]